MRLNLYSLQLFVAVVEEGTIAKAAERENIATSALSRRISELEQTLGISLILRQARGVEPTVAGSVLAKGARHLLHSADDLAEEIKHFATGLFGHVRIAANLSSITQFLPGDLRTFSENNPNVRIDLEESISTEVVRLVTTNAADIGIYTSAANDVDLETYNYRTDKMVLVVPGGHELSDRTSVSFLETLDFDHVGMHPGSAANFMLMKSASSVHRQINLRFQVTSYDAMISMIKAGMGIGVIPQEATRLYSVDGLTILSLEDAWAHRQLKLCVRSAGSLTPAATRLLSHLKGP